MPLDQVPARSPVNDTTSGGSSKLQILDFIFYFPFFASLSESVAQSHGEARNGKSECISNKATASRLWIKRMKDLHYFSGL